MLNTNPAYANIGTATGVGYSATSTESSQVDRGRATAVGYGALATGLPASLADTPDSLRLEIRDKNGALLSSDYVERRNLQFSVEHNGAGSLGFEVDLDRFATGLDDAMLQPDNIVRVFYGDLKQWPFGVAEGFVTSAAPTQDEVGRWTVPVPCPGSWETLDFGVLWPPAGATGDTREFSYTAGQTGPSWVAEEWGKPKVYLVKNSFRWKKKWPKGWPENKARWIGLNSPEKSSPVGTFKFVGQFTIGSTEYVHFYAAGDDTMRLYLNGALVKRKGRGAWHKTASFIRKLKAGTYVVASEVQNLPGGDNTTGFLFACSSIKPDGTRKAWLLRSGADTFVVRKSGGYFAQAPLPPDGWYPAAVLLQHVNEAKNRGVQFYTQITPTYTYSADSHGSGWSAKGKSEYDIGMSGMALAEDITAGGVDVAMLPGLLLSAWKNRGFDLRNTVVVSGPEGSGYTTRSYGRIRTIGLTKHESGWTETVGNTVPYGRKEITFSGGGTDGDLQADMLANQGLAEAASPEETFSATISNDDILNGAPMPFRDFNVADIITMEAYHRFIPVKVMSIAGAEDDQKRVKFTIEGYPV